MKKFLSLLVAGVIAAMSVALPTSQAQTYPINTPTYIPSSTLAATTLTAAGVVTFQVQGQGTVMFRVAGTNSVMSGKFQVTESRAQSPTWTDVPAQTVGGAQVAAITGNGLYRVNASGAALVRFNLASFTGTNVIVSATGSPGLQLIATLPQKRATYNVSTVGTTVASSGTDFLTVTGSASATLRVTKASCQGTSDNLGSAILIGVKRSTADTGGTTYAATVTSLDSNNTTPAATAVIYTGNPTAGTLVGNVASGRLILGPSATAPSQPLVFGFGNATSEQEVVLRGTGEVFALNANGATLPTGHALNCSVTWTQE